MAFEVQSTLNKANKRNTPCMSWWKVPQSASVSRGKLVGNWLCVRGQDGGGGGGWWMAVKSARSSWDGAVEEGLSVHWPVGPEWGAERCCRGILMWLQGKEVTSRESGQLCLLYLQPSCFTGNRWKLEEMKARPEQRGLWHRWGQDSGGSPDWGGAARSKRGWGRSTEPSASLAPPII